jgi:hypothetical protein
MDIDPLKDDYSIEDLQLGNSATSESYEILKTLFKDTDNNTDIEMPDLDILYQSNDLIKHSKAIQKLWEDISNVRDTIVKLDTFNQFCQLRPNQQLSFANPTLNFRLLSKISKVYSFYTMLMVEKGHHEEGIRQLCQLHRVAKKGLGGSVTLPNKMGWSLITENNIQTAYHILKSSKDKITIARLLKKDFMPLNSYEISLHRVFIAEYLVTKNYCQNKIRASSFFDSFDVYANISEVGLTRKLLSSIVYYLSFKENSTIRDIRNYWSYYINGVKNKPPDVSAAEVYLLKYLKNPQLRNMAGWVYVSITQPNFEKFVDRISNRKVLSDMLAISIHNYLGEKLEMVDFYTGTPYVLQDMGSYLLNAGPDGLGGSEDDIELGQK